jgi:hypothetical protein
VQRLLLPEKHGDSSVSHKEYAVLKIAGVLLQRVLLVLRDCYFHVVEETAADMVVVVAVSD